VISDESDHVAAGEAHGQAQRQMDEDMGCDAPIEEEIVGVEKKNVFASARRESLKHRRGHATIDRPFDDRGCGARGGDLGKDSRAFVG